MAKVFLKINLILFLENLESLVNSLHKTKQNGKSTFTTCLQTSILFDIGIGAQVTKYFLARN